MDRGFFQTLEPATDFTLVAQMWDEMARALDEDDERSESMLDFVQNALGFNPWSMQQDIIRAVDTTPRVTVRSCHAAGKSALAARVVLAFLYTRPHSIVVTTAPTARQVENVLWRYIRTARRSALRTLRGRALNTKYEIEEDWYAIGFKGTDDNTDALQGFHAENLLVVVDESAGVAESIFEGIEAILTGRGARLLLIGNPTSISGVFRDSFHRNAEFYTGVRINAYDTPNFTQFGITRADMIENTWREKVNGEFPFPALIDPAWVEKQIRMHGPDSAYVKSRIDAEFPDDAIGTFITLSWIENAEANAGTLSIGPDDEWMAGVDVARYGEDESVLTLRKGPVQFGMWAWQHRDTMETVGIVRKVLADHGASLAHINVDATGIGSGVADRLNELEYDAEAVMFAETSDDKTRWPNIRQQMWNNLRTLYRLGMITVQQDRFFDERLKGQLTDLRASYDSRYTDMVVERKDDAKKRGSHSPDRAESQALAFFDRESPTTFGITPQASIAHRYIYS